MRGRRADARRPGIGHQHALGTLGLRRARRSAALGSMPQRKANQIISSSPCARCTAAPPPAAPPSAARAPRPSPRAACAPRRCARSRAAGPAAHTHRRACCKRAGAAARRAAEAGQQQGAAGGRRSKLQRPCGPPRLLTPRLALVRDCYQPSPPAARSPCSAARAAAAPAGCGPAFGATHGNRRNAWRAQRQAHAQRGCPKPEARAPAWRRDHAECSQASPSGGMGPQASRCHAFMRRHAAGPPCARMRSHALSPV